MGFEPFQKFFNRAASSYGMTKQVKAAQICESFRKTLPEFFDNAETAKRFIQPAYFKNGELTINVESPAWGQEIIMRKDKIIRKMNEKAGRQVIKNLRTQLFS